MAKTFSDLSTLPIAPGNVLLGGTPGNVGGIIDTTSYALSGHDHDSDYADIIHTHASAYAAIDHDHDSDYAAIDHNHDSDYAAIGQGVPIGSIMMWPIDNAPNGWLYCDGSEVGRSTALGQLLGDTYGIGDGSTTYNLPDLRATFPIGAWWGGNGPGTTGGELTHTLTVSEIPGHAHYAAYMATPAESGNVAAFAAGSQGGYTSLQGGGLAHNNLPPYLALHFIIFGGV